MLGKKKSFNRISKIVKHLTNNNKYPPLRKRNCKSCIYSNNCSGTIDIEDTIENSKSKQILNDILNKIKLTPKGYGLLGEFYSDPNIYDIEMEHIFHKEWVFAGHEVQIKDRGMWITLNVGKHPIVIIRTDNNQIRAYHNICRHRGLTLCLGSNGVLETNNIVCDYHNWSYDINNGTLKKARDMEHNQNCSKFKSEQLGLFPVNIRTVAGYIFVCVSSTPPDFSKLNEILKNYSEPYHFNKTKVAYQSRIVENCNWKLTWENNRECYHCLTNHPELNQSFPGNWIQSEDGDFSEKDKKKEIEKLNLPYKFISSHDFQYRIMRHLFVKNSISMTLNGSYAIKNNKRLGRMPIKENVGNVSFYHYPSTWNHWQSDYAISFRVVPLTPTTTELVTTWLVPDDAQEGIDYDLKKLTEVWLATNEQDRKLVERVQTGVSSPIYQAGPFNEKHEMGVIEFVEWYKNLMKKRL